MNNTISCMVSNILEKVKYLKFVENDKWLTETLPSLFIKWFK